MDVDRGALYESARQRFAALVGAGVDPDAAVPATPAWTVHDVVAHLAGIARDAMTGNMEGAPGEAWTAAQVARGLGVPIADLLAQWAIDAQGVAAFLSSPDGESVSAAVSDVHSHEADLRHALGLPVAVPAPFLSWCAEALRDGFADAVREAGLAANTPAIDDVEWFRGRLGRRTEAEVRAYPWPVDATPYLESFVVFGPATHSLAEHH